MEYGFKYMKLTFLSFQIQSYHTKIINIQANLDFANKTIVTTHSRTVLWSQCLQGIWSNVFITLGNETLKVYNT
jgi:hypothetical protein